MAANCVGLDIGASAVKVVQLSESRKGVVLENFGINPLPPQSIVDGSIMNQVAVLEAIEALFSRLNIKRKDVALAVSGRNVIVKKITLPQMSVPELAEELTIEMKHHIPFDRDEVEVDHELVVQKNAEGQMEVLLVAAKKEIILDYMELVREAGLNTSVIDVSAFAVQNIYQRCKGINPSESIIILNIGAISTSINVVINGVTTFVRDVSIGGESVTGEIVRSLQLARDEAEFRKRESSSGLGVDPELMKIINKVCDVMAGEFQRSIDYFLSSIKVSSTVKLVVTGGGSILKPLIHAIERKSKLPVEVFDGFTQGVIVDPAKFDMPLLQSQAATASVALGLALRRPGDKR
ncbi:pilus assembly protein PilM [Myxococcota bacterium]|nr:pilus assembly protein PilM [Myxococcota bacterium]MBU1380000.1 pilus assembly protein PilM [Myxococcota bacterium]MBU1496757.1 pilus assembly protein PilM [Myxococcota bacterium]